MRNKGRTGGGLDHRPPMPLRCTGGPIACQTERPHPSGQAPPIRPGAAVELGRLETGRPTWPGKKEVGHARVAWWLG